MLSFQDWLKKEAKKPKRKDGKSANKSNDQGSGAFRDANNQGQAFRFNQEIPEPIVHVFPEP